MLVWYVILNIMYHFEEVLKADERKLNEQPSIKKDFYYYYYNLWWSDGIYVRYKLINPCVAGPYIINYCAARIVYN